MRTRNVRIITGLTLGLLAAAPHLALAQESTGIYRLFGLPSDSIALLALRFFQIFWGLTSLIAVGFLIYGALLWRSDDGDLVKKENGKVILKYSGIGLGVSVLLLVGISFLLASMSAQYTENSQTPPAALQGGIETASFGPDHLGAFSPIISHTPGRDEKNVARNTAIVVSFRQPIKPESVRSASGALLSDRVAIARASDPKTLVVASAQVSEDGKVLTITPTQLLGDASQKISYVVTVSALVQLANGDSVFGGTGSYLWNFETGTTLDVTPPQVESVFPVTSGKAVVARNAIIQVNFTEAISPTALVGSKESVVDAVTGVPIEGVWRIGNEYRTMTFTPNMQCDKNTCGASVGCFVSGRAVRVTLKSASLAEKLGNASSSRALTPYNGIVDVAGNALDGGGLDGRSKNGKADGSPADDYVWTFNVGSDLYKIPPRIADVSPKRDAVSVGRDAPLTVSFSQIMDLTSLHQSSIVLDPNINYTVESRIDYKAGKTVSTIKHASFKDNTRYAPEVRSEVRDVYQSCFAPCSGPLQ